MVWNSRLFHIYQRLADIFASSPTQMFSELWVIAVGDLYQLPPVIQSPVFSDFKNESSLGVFQDLWTERGC